MTKSEAVAKYVAVVSSIDPAWETLDSTSAPTQVSCISSSLRGVSDDLLTMYHHRVREEGEGEEGEVLDQL